MYQTPKNADYMTPKEKDNTPAKTLVQQAKDTGNDKLAELIAKAQESAKLAAARADAKREGRTVPSVPRKAKKSEPATVTVQVGQFTPEDVCPDDRTFIIRTRSADFHTPEMKALFWANGGADYMKAGLGYAAAFTNLRNDKLKAIQQKR